jgi:hypothetical protein
MAINIKSSHKGIFTAKAKNAGKSVQSYATAVLGKGSKASATTKKQANFAKVSATWNHK